MNGLFLNLILGFMGLNLLVSQPNQRARELYENETSYPFAISDEETFKNAIVRNRISLREWIQSVNKQHMDFLCFGERHDNASRIFLAEEVFPFLSFETLFLEADPSRISAMIHAIQSGRQHIEMHCADIRPILHQVLAKHPPVNIIGVEQTEEQERAMRIVHNKMGRTFISRDGDIARNILSHYTIGHRHVALYGACHCAYYNIGLGHTVPFYHHLLNNFLENQIRSMNILLVQNYSGVVLDAYFQLLGLQGETSVLPDTSQINAAEYNFQWTLKEIFDNYDVIIYFTPHGE